MRTLIDRLSRMAFTFTLMNYAAVAGLLTAIRGRKVWH
jgi:hypothetical protein